MGLNVRTVLALVIIVNAATVATFFYLSNNQNSSSELSTTGARKQENGRREKASDSDRQKEKTPWYLKGKNRSVANQTENKTNDVSLNTATNDHGVHTPSDKVDKPAGFKIDLPGAKPPIDNVKNRDNQNSDQAQAKQGTDSSSNPQNPDDDDDDDDEPPVNDAFIELEKLHEGLNETLEHIQEYAHNINPFRKFGFYKEIDQKYFEESKKGQPYYGSHHTGLKKNPSYCDYSDLHNYFNPSNIFEQMNFISDFSSGNLAFLIEYLNGNIKDLVRKDVIQKIGTDLMPQIYIGMEGYREPRYDLDIRATMFLMKKVDFHYFNEAGRQFLCAGQLYNHIPGSRFLTSKESLASSVNAYYEHYSKKPQCFNKNTLFPYSYRLEDASECKQFFKEINDEAYFIRKKQNSVNYLLKAGLGQDKTLRIQLFNEEEEQKLREQYQNGTLCGTIEDTRLAQKYIQNPLLLNKGNKFDFRMYMLIASVDPLIVYYHDGFLRVSLETYNKDSLDKSAHLTSTYLNNEKLAGITNETQRAELNEYQTWTLAQLQEFLHRSAKIADLNWLDSYLRPAMKKALIHLAKMSHNGLWQHSAIYEMFAVDFIIDDDLKLWLLEVNGSPKLVASGPKTQEFLAELLKDMIEIEYAYLRSKMKRLFAVVDKHFDQLHSKKALDISSVKEEFAKANKNYLEPEWSIRNDNSWQKVLDESLHGKEAYMGLLENECILD